MTQQREDRFANVAAVRVTETAANTLTFAEMLTGISLGQGVGMIIDQIDYSPAPSVLGDLVAAGDVIHMGITTSDDINDLSARSDRRILHQMALLALQVGTVVSLSVEKTPYVHQFFPPMIIAAPRVYLAVVGTSLAAPAVVDIRIYFRYITLTPQQYLELAESFILTG